MTQIFLSKRSWCDFSAWIAKSQELEGCEQVVGEYGGPAEEEDRHDQDQHVDHLDHHNDDEEEDGDDDNDQGQTEQQDQDQHADHLGKWKKLNLKKKMIRSHLPRFCLFVKSSRCCNYLQ